MKKSYIYPATQIHFPEVEQMMALSIQEGNATNDDALTKASNWEIWDEGLDSEEQNSQVDVKHHTCSCST